MPKIDKDVIEFAIPVLDRSRLYLRRSHIDNVQDIWRKYGWVPPTEIRKDFRSTLKTTAHLVATPYC
ncbi:MAG: hypothetical protein ACKOAO_11060 [Oxalobacteraceae bacterium]